MTFGDVIQDVRLLTAGRLDETLIRHNVRRAYIQILESHTWSKLYQTMVLTTRAPKFDGAVSVYLGSTSVQGVGTNWNQADVGSFIWIGSFNVAPIEIAEVISPTQLVLDNPWPGFSVVDSTYRIAPLYYSVAPAREVREVYERARLTKVTRDALNIIDPLRNSQAAQPAIHWAPAPPAHDGSLRIELWPVPQGPLGYVVEYIAKAPVLEHDDEEIILPYDVVKTKALEISFLELYAASGNATYKDLAGYYTNLYTQAYEDAVRQDRRLTAHATNIMSEPVARHDGVARYLRAVMDIPPVGRG